VNNIKKAGFVSIDDGIDVYKNHLKKHFAKILPLEKWESVCTFFDKMSDEDFIQFCMQCGKDEKKFRWGRKGKRDSPR